MVGEWYAAASQSAIVAAIPDGHARLPHPNPLPVGEGVNESLREICFITRKD